ncbi:MAG: hypothetical protein FGM24_04485 [Candidatus Kapabacteria bacterium]|nr:hypothetical protein [Candidatus Kapabacteria bacterium]
MSVNGQVSNNSLQSCRFRIRDLITIRVRRSPVAALVPAKASAFGNRWYDVNCSSYVVIASESKRQKRNAQDSGIGLDARDALHNEKRLDLLRTQQDTDGGCSVCANRQ